MCLHYPALVLPPESSFEDEAGEWLFQEDGTGWSLMNRRVWCEKCKTWAFERVPEGERVTRTAPPDHRVP